MTQNDPAESQCVFVCLHSAGMHKHKVQCDNKQIELPAKLLDYFLRSNNSNTKQSKGKLRYPCIQLVIFCSLPPAHLHT